MRSIDYDLVNSAAEEVIKEVGLTALAAKGKTGFDELLNKISERAVAKNLADLTAIATKIANGNAYSKHIHEFKELKITTREELQQHALFVLQNPTRTGLQEGKILYDSTNQTKASRDALRGIAVEEGADARILYMKNTN